MGMGMRHALKPKTPSGAARFNYINRSGKYERDKSDLVFAADCNMPDFAKQDALIFWENADEHERSDARICLELELNLPTELKTVEQQIAVVETYIKQLNEKAGRFPISYAIHNDKDGTNPHVHLMLSERTLDGIERPGEQYFKRGNSKNPERGGAIKSRWWHDKQNVFWSRAAWASSCNEVLIANGFDARFDPRTKFAQRAEAIEQGDLVRAVQLSTLTETHEGPHVGGIRKRLAAGQLERGDVELGILEKLDGNDTIKAFNAELQQFAVTAPEAQLRAFLECENAAERVAFIADLIEPQPQPAPEAQQQQEQKHEHNTRSATQVAERRPPDSRGVQQHIQHLFIVQECRNNQILRDTQARSELCGVQRPVGDVHYQPMAVQPEAQSTDRDARDGLHNVRAERVKNEHEHEHLTHAELCELYQNADDAADTAELQADVANCKHDDLKAEGRELIAQIKASKPTLIQRTLIKIGLLKDQSAELKTRVKPLVKSIKQAEIELKQLDKKARDLRSDADNLKIRLDFAEKLRPAEPRESPASRTSVKSVKTEEHVETKNSATTAATSRLAAFYNSSGYNNNNKDQSQNIKKSRGPRL